MPSPDLSNSLLGIIFRFWESQMAVTVDIESWFLQMAVPKGKCKIFKFLWPPDPTQTVDMHEYKRQVFQVIGASSPTWVKYALRKAAEDSKSHYPKALEFVQKNGFRDNFIEPVPSEPEGMCVFEDITSCLKEKDWNLRNGFLFLNVLWVESR